MRFHTVFECILLTLCMIKIYHVLHVIHLVVANKSNVWTKSSIITLPKHHKSQDGFSISPLFTIFQTSVSAWMVSVPMTRNSSSTSAARWFWPTPPASREVYLSPQCSHAVPPAYWSIWSYLRREAGMSPCRLPSPATATATVSIYIILTSPMQHQVLN